MEMWAKFTLELEMWRSSELLKVSRCSRNQVSRFTMANFGFAHAYASVSTIWSSKDVFFLYGHAATKTANDLAVKTPRKKQKKHTHDCFSHRIIHVLSLSSVICLLGYESCICSLLDNLHEPCRFLSYWMLSNHKTFHQRELFSGDNFLKIDSDAIPNSASARAHKADCHKPSVRHPGDHGGSGELVKRQAMFF